MDSLATTAPPYSDTGQDGVSVVPDPVVWVRTDRFLIELRDIARQWRVPPTRGFDKILRTRLREASKAGRIPCKQVFNAFAYCLADAPRVARVVLGLSPDTENGNP